MNKIYFSIFFGTALNLLIGNFLKENEIVNYKSIKIYNA